MKKTFSPSFAAVRILMLTLLFGSSLVSAQFFRDRIPPTAPTELVVTATTEHSVSP